jgi:Recombination endonuclease VII
MSATRVRCKKCKKVKALSKFSRDASRSTGHFPWCMECQKTSTSAFQDPDAPLNGHTCPMCDTPVRGHPNRRFCSNTCKERTSALRSKFNLSPAQFRAMVAATGGRCPVCDKKPTQWNVEHNHRTRQVYGVVCAGCNVGPIAFSYHDVELVKRLLNYLENPPALPVVGEVLVPEGVNQPSKIHQVWQRSSRMRRGR